MEQLIALLFFLPLLAMTIYISIRSGKEKNYEKKQKERLIKAAGKMLKQGTDYNSQEKMKARFLDSDFSREDAPRAEFILKTDKGSYPFEAREGNLIRYRNRKKEK